MNATPHSDHKSENNNDILLKNVDLLSKLSKQEVSMMPATEAPLPSVEQVKQIVSLVKNIIFPDYFNQRQPDEKRVRTTSVCTCRNWRVCLSSR